jgi:hypothetical protein
MHRPSWKTRISRFRTFFRFQPCPYMVTHVSDLSGKPIRSGYGWPVGTADLVVAGAGRPVRCSPRPLHPGFPGGLPCREPLGRPAGHRAVLPIRDVAPGGRVVGDDARQYEPRAAHSAQCHHWIDRDDGHQRGAVRHGKSAGTAQPRASRRCYATQRLATAIFWKRCSEATALDG